MIDPEDAIKEWIYEELERQGLEGTNEEYGKVVDELPEMVTRSDVEKIVAQLFPKEKKGNLEKYLEDNVVSCVDGRQVGEKDG